jgi:hypothetical protein
MDQKIVEDAIRIRDDPTEKLVRMVHDSEYTNRHGVKYAAKSDFLTIGMHTQNNLAWVYHLESIFWRIQTRLDQMDRTIEQLKQSRVSVNNPTSQ